MNSPDDLAAQWADRLASGPLTLADTASLKAWLDSHPSNRARLDSFREVHAQLSSVVPAMVRVGELPDFQAKVIRAPRHLFRKIAAVTTVAAAIVIASFLWFRRPAAFSTQFAQRQSIALADGSRLDLSAQTSVSVQLRGAERQVSLTSGEAYFAVSHDGRPFLVETPAGTVRVTGTAFNVRFVDHQLAVTVLEGSVDVTARNQPTHSLQPNDQLSVTQDTLSFRRLSAGDAQDVIAWRDGRIIFTSEPLASAAEKFSRYHGRELRLDPAVVSLELGGRFRLDDLNAFLDGIEVSLPVRVFRAPVGTIRILPRSEK